MLSLFFIKRKNKKVTMENNRTSPFCCKNSNDIPPSNPLIIKVLVELLQSPNKTKYIHQIKKKRLKTLWFISGPRADERIKISGARIEYLFWANSLLIL